ncbi:MAG TPA: hypothetical protein VJC37_03490 [Planctomycetota bacterium]|nr:hypothetical protein [Planctomycetota bacterium]
MPVSFKCECGKALRVKDEFAGKKVKCPSCNQVIVTPEITAEDLVATEGLAKPKESRASIKCLTCRAELEDESPVCMKCGTIRQVMKTQEKAQSSSDTSHSISGGAGQPFYMKRAIWVAGVAIIICGIIIYNVFIKQSEEEPIVNNKAVPAVIDAEKDVIKQSPPKQVTPEKLFADELQNRDLANLDKVVEHILKLREKSIPVLGAGIIKAERDTRIKSLSGLYILAYFQCYRSQMQVVIKNISRREISTDEELSRIALEVLYLLAANQPESSLLEFAGIAKKYTEQFSQVEKSPAVGFTKDVIIKQFTKNQSVLVKAKGFAYLVLLGDKWNIRQVITIMKDASGEAITFTSNALVELTGCTFNKYEEWNDWYSGNKNSSPTQWLINSLENAPEPQRQKTIKKLMSITGKGFSYSENATEDEKKAVINKWRELGETLK